MTICSAYLYFNAGFFFYRCPMNLRQSFFEYALAAIRDDPRPELCAQPLTPGSIRLLFTASDHALGRTRHFARWDDRWVNAAGHYRFYPCYPRVNQIMLFESY